MSPRKSDAREKLLSSTALLLQQQGYAATGLDQILQHSQAPKGSLYHYFPAGKEQLAAEALEQTGIRYSQMFQQALEGNGLLEGFRQVMQSFAAQLEESHYTLGCPIASVATTLQPEQEHLQQACQRIFDQWLAGLARVLQEHGLRAELAPLLLSSLEGALMLARVQKSTLPIHTTTEALLHLLEVQNAQSR